MDGSLDPHTPSCGSSILLIPHPLSSRVQSKRSGTILACQARLMELGQCDTDLAIEKGRVEKM